jgi:hypothetical protein
MGYAGAIRRADVPFPEKLACARHVAGWLATCAGQLIRRRLTGRPATAVAAAAANEIAAV